MKNLSSYSNAAWIALGVVWAIGALSGKRTVRVQALGSRLLELVLTMAAFGLLFWKYRFPGPLAWRFLPESPAAAWTGLALTAAGCAFAIWARLYLGRNWSAIVTIKQNHELVRRGPYAVVRHPIYAGILLAMFGTAISIGQVRGLIAVALALIAWHMKAQLEEAFMIQQFGEDYLRYRKEVKALIPFIC